MKDKKIETMLDDINEELQRHILSSKVTKSFCIFAEGGGAYADFNLYSQGGDIDVEALFIQSQANGIECAILLDGETVKTHSVPISMTTLSMPKGKHRLEVVAYDNVVVGKVSVTGLITSITQTA